MKIAKYGLFCIEPNDQEGVYLFRRIGPAFTDSVQKYLTPWRNSRRRYSGEQKSSVDGGLVGSQISFTTGLSQSLQVKPLSQPSSTERSFKEENKTNLKRLLLLGLRKAGITNQSGEFTSIWKHVYCGCVFTLRKELAQHKIEQDILIQVVRSHLKTFNIL